MEWCRRFASSEYLTGRIHAYSVINIIVLADSSVQSSHDSSVQSSHVADPLHCIYARTDRSCRLIKAKSSTRTAAAPMRDHTTLSLVTFAVVLTTICVRRAPMAGSCSISLVEAGVPMPMADGQPPEGAWEPIKLLPRPTASQAWAHEGGGWPAARSPYSSAARRALRGRSLRKLAYFSVMCAARACAMTWSVDFSTVCSLQYAQCKPVRSGQVLSI